VKFDVDGKQVQLNPEAVIVAGFTGRDKGEVERHVAELAAEGVTVPDQVPSFYPLPPSVLTQDTKFDALHGGTSGEAEIALVCEGDGIFVTLASDHTDRRAEAVDITLSKQVCPKPFATMAWRYEEIADHWDDLQLRSWIEVDGERRLYQEGTAAALLSPGDLLQRLRFSRRPESFVLLTGTIPARGGIRGADRFLAELSDPVTRRSIRLSYRVRVLDVLGAGA